MGCELPIQQAAMGGVSTTALASAVVDAGGFGMVSWWKDPVAGPCGVNFLMPFEPSLDEIRRVAGGVRVIEFFYADPRHDVVAAAHDAGALAGWQAGSATEALAAEEAGCDYVVAQGIEAGGHVRGEQKLDDLLALVLRSVKVPVIAAGGIATADRVAELMKAGADGVCVGTRFVTSPESGAATEYVSRLLAAGGDDTVLTEWFGEGWEHAPHRVLKSALAAAQESGWRGALPPTRSVDRDVADMAMYAGTGVGHVTAREPASKVVADLVSLI